MIVRAIAAALACLCVAVGAPRAAAQTYPSHTIRVIVPFPPGGPTDVAARLILQPLTSMLGQTVIIENQSGAGGRTGSRTVARAAPDGYTLLLGGTNLNSIIPALYKNMEYDAISGFVAVASIASDPGVLVVGANVKAKTVAELVADAKANPGKLKYGSAPGLASHLEAELLKQRAGIDVSFIPYRGGAPAITDLLGGQIDMLFNNRSVLLQLIQDGKLRALAVTSAKRWAELPNVPTMAESGFPDFPEEVWYGLLAPTGTPEPIVMKLNTAVNEALKSPELRANLAKLGNEAKPGTPKAFGDVLTADYAKYDAIVKTTGIKVE